MKDVQATVEAFSPQTRTSHTSKHGISSFFLFFWVELFALLGPDKADQNQCWYRYMRIQILNTIVYEMWGTDDNSKMVLYEHIGCSVAYRVQRGLVGSALAWGKEGPSSTLGSAPQGGSAHWADSYEDMEMGLSECLWMKDVWLYECFYCIV